MLIMSNESILSPSHTYKLSTPTFNTLSIPRSWSVIISITMRILSLIAISSLISLTTTISSIEMFHNTSLVTISSPCSLTSLYHTVYFRIFPNPVYLLILLYVVICRPFCMMDSLLLYDEPQLLSFFFRYKIGKIL